MADSTDEQMLRALFDQISNWGRWGSDDQLGTLNLIGPAQRLRGARCVVSGDSISMSRRVDVTAPSHAQEAVEWGQSAELVLENNSEGIPAKGFGVTSDRFAVAVHGATQTHLDALCHVFFDGQMYNGRPAAHVPASGSLSNDIVCLAGGVSARGILLDIPAMRGDYVRPETPVTPDELREAEQRGQTAVEPGDVVAIRLGRQLRWDAEGGQQCEESSGTTVLQGLHPECLTWFKERDVAMIVSDNGTDVTPPRYGLMLPIHIGALVFLGCPLVDNADLEGVAALCTRLQRNAFQFTIAPIPIPGATGSLVNPLATF